MSSELQPDPNRRVTVGPLVAELEAEIESLRRQVSAYAAIGEPNAEQSLRHGDVCRRLAERLENLGRLPDALQAYQEAVDAFGRAPDGDEQAKVCARRIVDGVREMWKRPDDRLYLLIARIEREQRQYEAVAGTYASQAACAFRIGTILQRRDRFFEAEQRYLAALALYGQAEDTGMRQAECHLRLAGLYHHELQARHSAIEHYACAEALFTIHEEPYGGEQLTASLCRMFRVELEAEDAAS